MVRVAGIVGYKNSGKTTLIRALAGELQERGHEVAVVKHTHHRLDVPGKDTAILREAVAQVALVSRREFALFGKRSPSLEEVISCLQADIVLVEGFKAERTFPKIACLRGKPDDRDLFDGLVIAACGPATHVRRGEAPLLDRDDVSGIADVVENRAFKLPKLDCGSCGYERCYDLAREIVAGTRRVEDCVPWQSKAEV
ncbi:MAG: molybdopterin-guanine dinucleotide biosynthesis protein B [Chloroflexi bacterium]|nr:MAG: molybdopterin-guanine dinucleotide biosynthesis protein B [Chloroflexota bacterium]